MIQRKQTLYLILASIVMLVCTFMPVGVPWVWLISAIAALGSLGDIFLYKRRPLQARLCVVLMALGLAYYMAVAAYQHSMGGELHLTWPLALPLAALLCWFMAHKGIMKDENLVRSLDRIR